MAADLVLLATNDLCGIFPYTEALLYTEAVTHRTVRLLPYNSCPQHGVVLLRETIST